MMQSVARSLARRGSQVVAANVKTAALAVARPAVNGKTLASAVAQQSVRLCSSSRFLSLADDEGRKGKNEDGEDRDDVEAATEIDEEREEVDGDLELDEEADINQGGVDICEETDDEVMSLYMENPTLWSPEKLARKFHLTKPRVEAILFLKREESGMTDEEFAARIQTAKENAKIKAEADAAKLAQAQAAGDEREIKRLQKHTRQLQDAEKTDEELSAHDEAVLMGLDEDAYRNPDFFFLNDEFEGYPPLVRRLGKHGATDKLFPEEALAVQKLASNNKVELLKSFAKPTDVKGKWRVAVKDISKGKKPLYMRAEDKEFRLASDQEVLPRTWVRRPSFFSGLEN